MQKELEATIRKLRKLIKIPRYLWGSPHYGVIVYRMFEFDLELRITNDYVTTEHNHELEGFRPNLLVKYYVTEISTPNCLVELREPTQVCLPQVGFPRTYWQWLPQYFDGEFVFHTNFLTTIGDITELHGIISYFDLITD